MYRPRLYYVYILASRRNGTLYTGVTGNLASRIYQHEADLFEGFTKRFGVFQRQEEIRISPLQQMMVGIAIAPAESNDADWMNGHLPLTNL